MQQAQSENRVTPYNKSKIGGRNSECIKVCVRVRPILPREVGKEEVVYYPTDNSSNLEVSHKKPISIIGYALLTISLIICFRASKSQMAST